MGLALDEITVRYPDGPDTITVLDRVSLRIERGEAVALTGASGSGKSTLLAVAGLLRRPDAGAISIDGEAVEGASRRRAAQTRRRTIGFVFQSSNLFPSLTAVEQLELVAHLDGALDVDARKRARSLLVELGLEERLDHRPEQLSGGERQRVGIARALMNQPALVLADEPTASLDEERGIEVLRLLTDRAAQYDVATLLVTHTPDQLPVGVRRLHLASGTVQ